jgi:hypothetical protein
MVSINFEGKQGVTVGQRKDGSRAVLWSDNEITWHDADTFLTMLTESITTRL